jgi:hypothetical protein
MVGSDPTRGRNPRHYIRLEYNELPTLADVGQHADGVIICAQFDAPHWDGPDGPQLALPGAPLRGFELRHEVERLSIPYFLEIETWRLPELEGDDDNELKRTARTHIAKSIDLPVTHAKLGNPAEVDALCRAAIESQANTEQIIAPYFTVCSHTDPWLDASLRCLRATLELLPDQQVAAWVRLHREFALNGAAELLAKRYSAGFGGRCTTLVLTVVEMNEVMQDEEALAGYLRLVGAFIAEGFDVIVDGVGEFSPVAHAMGASGSISGTRIYRSSRLNARHDGGHRRSAHLKYLVPGRLERMPVVDARRRSQAGSIPPCGHTGCRALHADATEADVRRHNAHLLADEGRQAYRLGPGRFAERLRREGLTQSRRWAQALEDAVDAGAASADA